MFTPAYCCDIDVITLAVLGYRAVTQPHLQLEISISDALKAVVQ